MSDFGREIEQLIPRLRRYARALTRDRHRADDLVQDCLVRALSKQHLFQEGTNLRAWLFALLHNQHVNEVRRATPLGNPTPIDELAPVPVEGSAISSLELKDLERAIAKLPIEQRQVILLVGLEGMPYDEVASILNVPVGTVRSRLSADAICSAIAWECRSKGHLSTYRKNTSVGQSEGWSPEQGNDHEATVTNKR